MTNAWIASLLITLLISLSVTAQDPTPVEVENPANSMVNSALNFIRSTLSGLGPQLQKWLSNIQIDIYEDSRAEPITQSRTFGRIKRLQQALLPVMFKMGVMSTLMVLLVLMTKKILVISLILLMINFTAIAVKLALAFKSKWGELEHHHGHPQKDIHIHLHNGGQGGYQPAYSGWNAAPEINHGISSSPYSYQPPSVH